MPSDNTGAGAAALQGNRCIVAVADGVGGVVLPVALGEIASTARDGDDLAVDLAGGGEVVLAGFFAAGGAALLVHGDGPGGVDEVRVGPGGGIAGSAPAAPGRLEAMFGAEAARAAAASGADGVRRRRDGPALAVPGMLDGDGAGIRTPALVGGLLLLGVVVAACGGGGGGGGGGQPATTAPVAPDPALNGNAQAVADEIESLRGGSLDPSDRRAVEALTDAFVPAGGTVADARFDAASGELELGLDTDGVPGVDVTRRLVLDDRLRAIEERVDSDADADGAVDRSEFDDDPDGTFAADRIEDYTHDAMDGGSRRVRRTRFDDDASDDGTYERDESYVYVGASGQLAYTVVDDAADGTPDSLVFEDIDFEFSPDARAVADSGLAGVTMVRLAGAGDPAESAVSGGAGGPASAASAGGPGAGGAVPEQDGHATAFGLSDAALTAFAADADGYVLTVDGGTDDMVELSGGIHRTGGTDASGRHEYQGTDGRVLVDPDVTVTGAMDPLAAVLDDPAAATLAMFGLVEGLTGVTAANLGNVRAVLGAYDATTTPARAALTLAQVQSLVDIVNDAAVVPPGAEVDTAVAGAGALTLTLDGDGDADIERTVEIALDAGLAPTGVTIRRDTDGDGYTDDRVEFDTDADGSVDRTERRLFDGSGTLVAVVHDDDADGTADRLVFEDGVDHGFTVDAAGVDALVGLDGVELAGGAGATTFTLSADMLGTMAGGAPRYILTIDGGADDTVVIAGPGFSLDGSEDVGGTTYNVYNVYSGAGGVVRVQDGVAVSFADPLAAVVADPSAATVAQFTAAGVTGVTAANLANVRTVVGALVDGAAGEATAGRMAALVALVDRYAPGGAAVRDVAFGAGDATVTLGIDTDSTAAPATADLSVEVSLDAAFAATGTVVRVDADRDGNAERVDRDADADGTPERVDLDADGDGTAGDEVRIDADEDGTAEEVRTDSDEDGTAERAERRLFDGVGVRVAVVHDDDADGTADRLVFEDGVAHGFTEAAAQAAGLAGLGGVELAGGAGGATTLTVSDALLTTLAGGAPGYILTVDGGADDEVAIAGAGLSADGTVDVDGTAYNEYSGSDGALRVLDGVEVTFGDPLAAVVSGPSAATAAQFIAAGVGGVDAGGANLANVRTVVAALVDEAAGEATAGRMTALVALANRYAPGDAAVLDVAFGAGDATVTLGIDTDSTAAPATADLSVEVSLDAAFAASDAVVRVDADRDGTAERVERDAGVDGTAERVELDSDGDGTAGDEVRIDADGDGTAEEVRTDSDEDGTAERVEDDADGDGTWERARIDAGGDGTFERTLIDADDDGTAEREDADTDEDGTVDTVSHDPDGDGVDERTERYLFDGGVRAAVVHDGPADGSGVADGTADRLVFDDDVDGTVAVDAGLAADLAGLASVTLAGGTGASRLALSDDMLGTMAGGTAGYALAIDGGPDDTVALSGGIHRTGVTVDGRHEYQGTRGRVLVDGDVTVTGAVAPLAAVLGDPAGATLAMFGLVGALTGVTAANVEGVKAVLGAFDGTTTPTRADLTLAQVQALADIVGRYAPGAGDAVRTAAFDGAGPTLTLGIDTDTADSTDDAGLTVEIGLDAAFTPTEAAFDGADAGGEADRTESYGYAGGTHVWTLHDTDADGTPDRLAFEDGVDHGFTVDAARAMDLAGLDRVELAGAGGDTAFTVSHETLGTMAGDEEGYTLTVDGGTGDSVVIVGPGFSPDGSVTVDGTVYNEWSGANGTLRVHEDVDVEVSFDPLAAVLVDPSAATLAMFDRIAGLDGVTAGSVESVKTVLGAFGATTSPALAELTLSQVQGLVGIVNDSGLVPAGAEVEAATFTPGALGTLALDVDEDADGTVERRVEVALDGALRRFGSTTRHDDGRVEAEVGVTGPIEWSLFDSGGSRVAALHDDALSDRPLTYGYGPERLVFEPGYAGTFNLGRPPTGDVPAVLVPQDALAGAIRSSQFLGVALGYAMNNFNPLEGVNSIALAGAGDMTLVAWASLLDNLAYRAGAGTTLTVDGDSGDTVRVDGRGVTLSGAVDVGGTTYNEYLLERPGRTLRVHDDVTVAFSDPLAAVLVDPAAATLAMFDRVAGLDGVTAGSVEGVKAVLGAFDSTTTPARADLTQAQVQALVDIVGRYAPGSGDGVVRDAGYGHDRHSSDSRTLTLMVDTDATDSTDDATLTVEVELDAAFLPAGAWFDGDDMGSAADRVEAYGNVSGTHVWTIHDADADDTPDRLVFEDDVTHVFDPDDLADFAGITGVTLAGGTGETLFTLSDADLTTLRGAGGSGYTLTVDGGTDDRVRLDGWGFMLSGTVDVGGAVYRQYEGTDGTLRVRQGVAVDFSDPLAAVLADLAGATAPDFAGAGVAGLDDGGLANLKTVLGAFGAETSPALADLRRSQVRRLLDIVNDNDLVPAGAEVEAATFTQGALGTLTLDVDEDADGTVERRVEVALDGALRRFGSVTRHDDDGDGTADDRVEAELSVTRVVEWSLFDSEGAKVAALHDLVRPDDHGFSAEWLVFEPDYAGTFDLAGAPSGDVPAVLVPQEALADAVRNTPSLADTLGYAVRSDVHSLGGGVNGVSLAGAADMTLVAPSGILDDLLQRTSFGFFTVEGDSGDTVRIDGRGFTLSGTVDIGGTIIYREYAGTHGRLRVHEDVAVAFSDPLAAVLVDPAAATLAMFDRIAGLDGVTAGNVESVKAVLGAFDATTTPARGSLTLAQVQALADVAGRYAPGSGDGVVRDAGYGDDPRTLTLMIDTDAADSTDDATLTVEVGLDAAFLPTGAEFDGDDAGGEADRTESYGHAGGTHVWTLHDADADGTPDRLVFEDGVAHVFDPASPADFAGIAGVTLAGGAGGDTRIVITDATLTALAGGVPGYVLTIEGDSSDTVSLPSSSIGRVVGDGATDSDGRHGYEGTDGRIYVDPDVTVTDT